MVENILIKALLLPLLLSLQSCPTLCDPIDSSPPGYPIPGILQARTLEWVAIAFSLAHIQISRTVIILFSLLLNFL